MQGVAWQLKLWNQGVVSRLPVLKGIQTMTNIWVFPYMAVPQKNTPK